MNFITFYWYHDQVQLMNTYENKNYDHNFIIEDFREKIEILEIGPFRKMAKTFFFYQRYQLDFSHNFSSYKSLIFQIEIKSFKT